VTDATVLLLIVCEIVELNTNVLLLTGLFARLDDEKVLGAVFEIIIVDVSVVSFM
jgi:hypothetical protein